MPDLGGKVTGLADIEAALKAVGVEISEKALRSSLRKGAQLVIKDARSRIDSHSGELAKAIGSSTRVDKGAGRVTTKIRVNKKQAHIGRFVEDGTKPHEIKPRNGKALQLHGGVFVDKVDHPGAQPKPFLAPAADAQFPAVVAEVISATKTAIEKFKKKAGK